MYPDPLTEAVAAVVLERQRIQSRRYLSPQLAETLTVHAERKPGDRFAAADLIAVDVVHDILTEHLPAQTVTHRVRYQHPEAIGRRGYAVDARFATWLDHFAATYRGRWWGRLLRLHRRELRYTFVPVPYITSAPVECDHKVTVSILDQWRYPHADTTLRDLGLGEPVLYAGTMQYGARAVTRPGGTEEVW